MKNNIIQTIVIAFALMMFILGGYLYSFGAGREGFTDVSGNAAAAPSPCPNLLVKRTNGIVLYNTQNPAVNPIVFQTMEEYIQYLEKQRAAGTICPILYLEEENNAQGQQVYRVRPTIDGTENGLPPTTYIPAEVLNSGAVMEYPHYEMSPYPSPYDSKVDAGAMYNGYDAMGLYIGRYTALDKIHDSKEQSATVSDNPMDTNWGGQQYSEEQIKSGAYDEYNIYKPTLAKVVRA